MSVSKNAGTFLKPHIHTLVPVMLESLTGLAPQYLNSVALRVSGQEEVQQKLDKARVAAYKMSPMMESINLVVVLSCSQYTFIRSFLLLLIFPYYKA